MLCVEHIDKACSMPDCETQNCVEHKLRAYRLTNLKQNYGRGGSYVWLKRDSRSGIVTASNDPVFNNVHHRVGVDNDARRLSVAVGA